jgi:hypothetical protein
MIKQFTSGGGLCVDVKPIAYRRCFPRTLKNCLTY